MFGFAGTAAALFLQNHQKLSLKGNRRANGRIVDISYLRIGTLLNSFSQLMYRDPLKRKLAASQWAGTVEEVPTKQPGTTLTSDGQWVLNMDPRPQAAKSSLRALDLSPLSMMWHLLQGAPAVMSSETRKAGAIAVVREVLHPWLVKMQAHVRQMTWADLARGYRENDVWHCRIALPYQMLHYSTACEGQAAGIVLGSDLSSVTVRGPMFLTSLSVPALPTSRL